jgi:hypothetical protein
MKSKAATIVLAIVFIANVFSARADEKLSSLQTALSSTTIGGYGSTFTAFQIQPRISGRQAWLTEFSQWQTRNDGASLLLLPPINPSEVEITVATFNLINVDFAPSFNSQPIVRAIYDGNSSGVEMIETSREDTLIDQPVQPLLPPTPITDVSSGFQPQISPLVIQAVPEPSPSVLLAVGLLIGAAIFRRSRIHAQS